MKLELTQKDILLLKLVGSVVIAFFIIRFLLMPGLERLQESAIRNDTLQETVSGIEEAIDSIPVLEQTIENRLEELSEASEPYYESMENRQVDELLTGLALKHGLFPVSLSIDEAAASLPGPYLYGVTASQAAAGADTAPGTVADGIDGPEDAVSGGVTGSAVEAAAREAEVEAEAAASGLAVNPDGSGSILSGGYMQTAVGHMVLRGEETKLYAFLGDVEANYPAIRLRSLGISEGVYFDEDWNRVEQPDMRCELEIYMYDRGSLE